MVTRSPDMGQFQRFGLIVLITAGASLCSTAGVSLTIVAPAAGQTLVSGYETLVQVSVDEPSGGSARCAKSDVELHVTAQSGLSHLVLSRLVESEPVPENVLRASIVVPKPGVWELTAELFCSVSHMVEPQAIDSLSKLMTVFSPSEEAKAAHPTLKPALEQLRAGQLVEASKNLDAAMEAILIARKYWGVDQAYGDFFEAIRMMRENVGMDLYHMSQARIATTSIAVLAVPDAGPSCTTMEGCPDLLRKTGRRHRPGFGDTTWMLTRECLASFLDKFPDNAQAGAWLDEVSSLFGSRGKADGGGHVWEWVSESRVTAASAKTCQEGRDDGDQGGSGAAYPDAKYLSVILAAKHDDSAFCQRPRDHCLDRLRAFLATTLHLLEQNSLSSDTEIIFVEYVPMARSMGFEDLEYLRLADAIRLLVNPPSARPPDIRVLTVTKEQHDKIYNPYGFPFLEFHAKNVAARRARGRFILFTNPDDVWAEGLGALLGRRQLRSDVFYVSHRGSIAIPIPVLPHTSASQMLAFAAQHGRLSVTVPQMAYTVGTKWNTSACDPGEGDELPMGFSRAAHGFFFIDAIGDFFLASRCSVMRMRGHPEIPHLKNVDGLLPYTAAAHGLRQLMMPPNCSIYHQDHARSSRSHVESFQYAHAIVVAADLLAAGPLANHRPPDKSSAGVNDTSFYEQLEYHRWNGEDWGLASEAFDEVWLTAACRGAPLAWSAEGEAERNGDNVWTTSLAAGSAGSPSHLHGDLHQPVSVRAYHPPVVCECAGAIDAAEPREAPGGGEEQACAGGSRMEFSVSVHGIIASFCPDRRGYRLLVEEWSRTSGSQDWVHVQDWTQDFSSGTVSYSARVALQSRYSDDLHLILDVLLLDGWPGLPQEEALLAKHSFRVRALDVRCGGSHTKGFGLVEDGITGIIHVGAHLGEESMGYHAQVKHRVVHVECNPELLPRLHQNVACLGQVALQGCLWNTDGEEREFWLTDTGTDGSSLVGDLSADGVGYNGVSTSGSTKVRTRSWSSLLREFALLADPVYNMLVLDTQGAEFEILESMAQMGGAAGGLHQFAKILVEVSNLEMRVGQQLQPAVEDLLLLHGFVNVQKHYPRHGDVVYVQAGYRPYTGASIQGWNDSQVPASTKLDLWRKIQRQRAQGSDDHGHAQAEMDLRQGVVPEDYQEMP